MTLQTAVLDGNAAAAHSAAATGLIETVADHAGLGPAVPVFLSSLGIRGHRQTDRGEKCRYQRHHLGLEPNASRRTQPVFDTAIDQQEQDTPHYSGRPSGHQPAPSSRRHDIDEELLHRRVGALPARQGRQHLADIFTAQPQEREKSTLLTVELDETKEELAELKAEQPKPNAGSLRSLGGWFGAKEPPRRPALSTTRSSLTPPMRLRCTAMTGIAISASGRRSGNASSGS